MECVSCLVLYDENGREPRSLKCGHSCCSECMWNNYRNGTVLCCSKCNQLQHPENELPVNHGVLELLKLLRENKLENTASSLRATCPVQSLSMQEFPSIEPRLFAGICPDHGYYKVFFCSTCQLWLCRDCTIIDHEQPVCKIISAKQAVKDLKKSSEDDITAAIGSCELELGILGRLEISLDSTIDTYKGHDVVLGKVVQYRQKKLTSLQEEYRECTQQQTMVKDSMTRLKEILKEIEEAKGIEDLLVRLATVKDIKAKNKTRQESFQEPPVLQECTEASVDMAKTLSILNSFMEPEAEVNPKEESEEEESEPEAEVNPKDLKEESEEEIHQTDDGFTFVEVTSTQT